MVYTVWINKSRSLNCLNFKNTWKYDVAIPGYTLILDCRIFKGKVGVGFELNQSLKSGWTPAHWRLYSGKKMDRSFSLNFKTSLWTTHGMQVICSAVKAVLQARLANWQLKLRRSLSVDHDHIWDKYPRQLKTSCNRNTCFKTNLLPIYIHVCTHLDRISWSRGIHEAARWQFWRNTQPPLCSPSWMSSSALSPCPCPRDTELNCWVGSARRRFARFTMKGVGSVPSGKKYWTQIYIHLFACLCMYNFLPTVCGLATWT